MGVLDSAVAWWHADRYDPAVDLQSWLDQSGNGHDFQLGSTGGVDSFDPTFLPYEGEQYVRFQLLTGDRNIYMASHPVRVTGDDLELFCDVQMDNYADWGYLFGKAGTPGTGYTIRIQSDKSLILYWNEAAGTNRFVQSTASLPTTNGDRVQIKVTLDGDNGAGQYDVKFWHRPTDADSWIQLGSTITGGTGPTTIYDEVKRFEVFGGGQSSTTPSRGRYYRVTCRDGIDGTIFLDLDFTDPLMIGYADVTFSENSVNADVFSIYRGSVLEPIVVDRNLWAIEATSYFELADNPAFDFGATDPMTVCIAFQKITNASGAASLLNKKGLYFSAAVQGWSLSLNPAETPVFSTADGVAIDEDAGAYSPDSERYTVIGRRDVVGDELELFLNGVGSGSPKTPLAAGDLANAKVLRIGYNSDGANAMHGVIISAAVFDSALSDADIATLHTELMADQSPGNGGGVPDPVHPLNAGQLQHGALGFAPRHWR